MKRRLALLVLLAIVLGGSSAWWACDPLVPCWVFPQPERYQLVPLAGGSAVVRLNTRTGSLAIYAVVPDDSSYRPRLKAISAGYVAGPFSAPDDE